MRRLSGSWCVSPALSWLEHHAGFEPATTAWRAGVIPVSPMMRGGRSCLPGWIPAWSLSPPMCASVAVSTAEGTVSTSCGSAVLNMDCAPESLRFSGHNANQRFDYTMGLPQPTAACVLLFLTAQEARRSGIGGIRLRGLRCGVFRVFASCRGLWSSR